MAGSLNGPAAAARHGGHQVRSALLDGGTLGDSLDSLTRTAPAAVAAFPASGEQITSAELGAASVRSAHAFRRAGIEPGALVGVLVPTDVQFFVTIFGLWRAGAAVSVLPVQAGFGGDDGTARRLARIARATGMRHLILDRSYQAIGQSLRDLVPGLTVIDPRIDDGGGSPGALPAVDPGSLAIVQFTSGSTSAPKGVMLP